MSEIDLHIQDTIGKTVALTITQTISLHDLSILGRDELELPLEDIYNRPLNYALFHCASGRFLNPELTVYGHHIKSGDRLRILPRAFSNLFELELQTEPNPGMLFPIYPKETSLGRDFSNDIVIRHKAVSRSHGIFEWKDGFHLYMDLDSANGSWLNNKAVTEPTPIANGDILALGKSVQLMYRERVTRLDGAADADDVIGKMEFDESRTKLVEIPKARLYLSFNPGEQHLADVIDASLTKAGMRVHHNVDNAQVVMHGADAMIVILSREAVKEKWLLEEWKFFTALRKPILVVLFEPCRVPDILADLDHFVEYHYNEQELSRDILDALNHVLL